MAVKQTISSKFSSIFWPFLQLSLFSRGVVSVGLQDKPYGSKTPYEFSFNSADFAEIQRARLNHRTCQVVYANALLRHGSRYPSRRDIEKAKSVAAKIRGQVKTGSYHTLNQWQVPFDVDDQKMLSPLGGKEHYELGVRYAKRFQAIINRSTVQDLCFQATGKKRTFDSARHFQAGLCSVTGCEMASDVKERNDILRFYDYCPRYLASVETNKSALEEFHKFTKGPEMLQLAHHTSRKLGLQEDLSVADLAAIYPIMAIEEGLYGTSPWVPVFDRDSLELLEYHSDLENYWEKGYGHSISYKQSCILFQDIISRMDEAIRAHSAGKRYEKATFSFTHAEAILPLLCGLGLFKDPQHLTAMDFPEGVNRKFKTSRISPMAANVAFVLYHCPTNNSSQNPMEEDSDRIQTSGERDSNNNIVDTDWPQSLQEYMVQLLVQEMPQKFPFCQHFICPYDEVKTYYEDFINCDFNEICKLPIHFNDEL